MAADIVMLTRSDPEDVFRQIVHIHMEEIPKGFLPQLGEDFLQRLYHHLAGSPHAFVLAARKGDTVLGFIAGTESTKRVYMNFALTGGPRVFRNLVPKLISVERVKRVIETLLYPSKAEVQDLPSPEILNFCVSSRAQRGGVGRALFEALAAEFRRRGIHEIRIVTGESQQSAQAFYDRLGARRITSFEVHEGTGSVVFTKAL